jgi:hypothetical protein
MFLTPSDFVGKYELHKGMYSQPNLVDYIERYERKYLIDLFGAQLFDEFVADLDPITKTPISPSFQFLFNPFQSDVTLHHVLVSDGIIDMLKGFIYFEYSKDLINQPSSIGNVIPQNENSRVVSTLYSTMYGRYNDAVKTFRAIRDFILLNKPLPTGQIIEVENIVSGSGYLTAGNVPTINFDSIIYSVATAFNILNAGTGYTSQTNVLCNPAVFGVVVDVVDDGSGGVQSVSIVNGGSGFNVGDTLTIPIGNGDCIIEVASITDEIVVNPIGSGMFVDIDANGIDGCAEDFILQNAGNNYIDGDVTSSGSLTGTGAEFTITTISGAIDTIILKSTGNYYQTGDVLTLNGGDGDGTIEIVSLTNGEIQSITLNTNTSGTNYSVGDSLIIEQNNNHTATFDVSRVGVGGCSNWNGVKKQFAYWI